MSDVVLSLGPYRFEARLESSAAPRTCAALCGLLPFASQAGPLAGNHFLTMTSGLEQLPEIGRLVLWQGAQTLRIDAA